MPCFKNVSWFGSNLGFMNGVHSFKILHCIIILLINRKKKKFGLFALFPDCTFFNCRIQTVLQLEKLSLE